LATLAAAGNETYLKGFGPKVEGFDHVAFGNLNEMRAAIGKETAAIFVEPVQGEGGVRSGPPGYLRGLREIADEFGLLLVYDEVQSGMGRTGKMYACQHWGVDPDILCLAKGIASGMPLGAMIAREDIMTWDKGAHGSTYAGNPVCCAAALATIELLEGGLIENARVVGDAVLKSLGELRGRHPTIADVRGMGLMIGVDFDTGERADAVEMACLHRGLLVLRAGDTTVRMAPPLVLDRARAEVGLRIFDQACQDIESGAA
jgi:acetylornithine/succinyldiaminopimelate/putrescine aminotransferase